MYQFFAATKIIDSDSIWSVIGDFLLVFGLGGLAVFTALVSITWVLCRLAGIAFLTVITSKVMLAIGVLVLAAITLVAAGVAFNSFKEEMQPQQAEPKEPREKISPVEPVPEPKEEPEQKQEEEQEAEPQVEVLGGLPNLGDYCRSLGYDDVNWTQVNKIEDWMCLNADGSGEIFYHGEDVTPGWHDACRYEYGEGAFADGNTVMPHQDPYGAQCIKEVS